jgi:hypothetical protein
MKRLSLFSERSTLRYQREIAKILSCYWSTLLFTPQARELSMKNALEMERGFSM